MKKNSPSILYLVLAAIILTGVLLFIFKDSILEMLRRKSGVDSAAKVTDISATVVTVATSSALDTSILKLPRFTVLVNHVTNYDFDNICWRPDTITSKVVAPKGSVESDGEATSTARTIGACVQGNNSPFKTAKD